MHNVDNVIDRRWTTFSGKEEAGEEGEGKEGRKNERKGKVNCLKMRGEYGIIGQKEKKDMTERDLTEEAKAAITAKKRKNWKNSGHFCSNTIKNTI